MTSSLVSSTPGKTGPAELGLAELDNLADAFAAVPDPRSSRGRWHPLVAILLIAACAVTCDANGFTAIWQWADDAPQWVLARLRVRVDPLTGVYEPPSERTIRRTIARVDARSVEQAAGGFVADQLVEVGLGSHRPPVREREARRAERAAQRDGTRPPGRPRHRAVAFDGKVLRGARRRSGTRVNLLAAADHATGTVLGQREIDAKTNEIPELRTLVGEVNLAGCVLTADAIHCQTETAKAIIAAGGHYLLTLKANQITLLEAVIPLLSGTQARWSHQSHTSIERGHGRTEQRTVRLAPADEIDFPHAAQVFRTVRYRGGLDGQRTGKQIVFGITSLPADQAGPADIAYHQRRHWGIENRLHHVRDTTFDEDRCQVRTGNAPRVMASLRNLSIDTFRANGYVNIAHARRHHAHRYDRVLDLYGL